MQWNQYDNALSFVFLNVIFLCTEHMAAHYIVPRHVESIVLGLSNSWYTTTSTTSNTYIDYRPVSQMRALLVAYHELALDYDTFPKLLFVFGHKA